MFGVDNNAEKIGVEAFMLKKMTKDLPLHPIPLTLKWDLSDLKLADPDFRTPPCIDLLLGAEVFTSIFLDGRRTGPQGMPSAINTCFGLVLFGKIQGNDVVDITSLTLELNVLRDIAGSTRSSAAVLTANEQKDLHHPQWRKGRQVVGGTTPSFKT